ncbi:hypothetical protein IEE94_00820 [Yimella sp. cx-573]|nr:hypothetical protein [Yimella sp. cx-573]
MKKTLAALACAAVAAAGLTAGSTPAQAAGAENAGTYYNATPTRLGDTRASTGLLPKGKLSAGRTVSLPVLGRGGVPSSGVSAVVVNLTAINTSSAGWLTAYASGTAKPGISSMNFAAGWTGATTATVDVGRDGKINLNIGRGTLDVAVDVVGYYGSESGTGPHGASYLALGGLRLEDTRPNGKLRPGQSKQIVLPWSSIPQAPSTLQALRVNLTGLGAAGNGWLTAWNGAGAAPYTSALNFAKGEVSPNSTIVPMRYIGNNEYAFTVKNTGPVAVDLLVDLEGFYTRSADGPSFVRIPKAPTRVVDSRIGKGVAKQPLSAGRSVTVRTSSGAGFSLGFEGVATGVNPAGSTYLSIYSNDPRPGTSTVNLVKGVNRSNGVTSDYGFDETAPESVDDFFMIYNSSARTDVIVDVTAVFGFVMPDFDLAQKRAKSAQDAARKSIQRAR